MELLFTFNGIKLQRGEYPRAEVAALFALTELPAALSNLKITFSLPLSRSEQTLEAIAARSLAACRAMLKEDLVIEWVAQQSTEPHPPLVDPPDAAARLMEIPMSDEALSHTFGTPADE